MSYTAIQLDRLPSPDIVDQPAYEDILAALKTRLVELEPDLEPALELESEPLVKFLQGVAYREMLLRQELDDAARGNMLAFATDAQLDHLAALFGVERQVVQYADDSVSPPVEEVLEGDSRLRYRAQLALESYTTAGPEGAYVFWGLSASAAVSDIAVTQTETPGEVLVTVLSADDSGVPDAGLLALVESELEPRRPLTDHVIVAAASVTTYSVVAELTLYEGPDAEVVRAAAQDELEAYVAEHYALGHDIPQAGLIAALFRPGVQNVTLTQPVADLVVSSTEAAHCTGVVVTVGGRDV